MEIILIRHAETAGNLERRYIGVTDQPLCEQGIKTAVKSGIMPSVPLVYASPMIRAAQTATIKFPNARVMLVPGLREMDFGLFEGRTADEMREDAEYLAWVSGGCREPCPRGEGIRGFTTRVCVTFSELVGENIARRHSYLLIVAHGGTIMAIMERFARPRRDYFEWPAPNCGGYRAQLDEETWPANPRLTDVRDI
ncbi:MAG: histidine phosphatase family protein [Oscillospiraceae bacterium]|jgi:alpha-ribazole phosphatase|nr:histidine phosphatase family protein [Oscillospiraceae bacterium]